MVVSVLVGSRNWNKYGGVASESVNSCETISLCFCNGTRLPWDVQTLTLVNFSAWLFYLHFYNNLTTVIQRQILSFEFLVNIWISALRYRQSIQEEAREEKKIILHDLRLYLPSGRQTTDAHLWLQIHSGTTMMIKYKAMKELTSLLQTEWHAGIL